MQRGVNSTFDGASEIVKIIIECLCADVHDIVGNNLEFRNSCGDNETESTEIRFYHRLSKSKEEFCGRRIK